MFWFFAKLAGFDGVMGVAGVGASCAFSSPAGVAAVLLRLLFVFFCAVFCLLASRRAKGRHKSGIQEIAAYLGLGILGFLLLRRRLIGSLWGRGGGGAHLG